MFCKGMCGEWGAGKKGMKGVAKSPRVYSFAARRKGARVGGGNSAAARARAPEKTHAVVVVVVLVSFGVESSSRIIIISCAPCRSVC